MAGWAGVAKGKTECFRMACCADQVVLIFSAELGVAMSTVQKASAGGKHFGRVGWATAVTTGTFFAVEEYWLCPTEVGLATHTTCVNKKPSKLLYMKRKNLCFVRWQIRWMVQSSTAVAIAAVPVGIVLQNWQLLVSWILSWQKLRSLRHT